MRRLIELLPKTVTRAVRILAWATLVSQVLIVVTGGAVRLTASGLGCPTWPKCTDDSFISTPEMGIHGVIEFGNRLLTFALVLVALATFLSIIRMRKSRRDLFWLSLAIGVGIPVQAVIGGISVLTQLNPYVVGLHFVVSAILVCLSTLYVSRVYGRDYGRTSAGIAVLARLAFGLQFVTVLVGILVTGSGPHAGDANAPRNGLNSEVLQHIHSYPAYAALSVTALVLALAMRVRHRRTVRAAAIVLALNATQIVVGLAQANLGLPVILVALHMLLACLVLSAGTWLVLCAKRARADQSRLREK